MASASETQDFPERVGRYELLVPIASGGMATVYLARQTGAGGFEREVALKLMHPHMRAEEGWTTELLEEGRLSVRIRHPNVVQVLDVDEGPEGVHLAMEYVEGDSVAGLLRLAARSVPRLTIPIPICLAILRDALSGLHAAHELRGSDGEPLDVVHRDFSPQNILVGIDGIARLTDFGVAKAASRLSLTTDGLIKGKFGYMSPEQVRAHALDRRSDVWAAGVCAWELIAGKRLFYANDQGAILFRIVSADVPRLGVVREGLPPAVASAIASALTLDIAERCPTAKALWERLHEAWAPHGEVASHEEVAAVVRSLTGDTLTVRRKKVKEVLDRRTGVFPGSAPPRAAPSARRTAEASAPIVPDSVPHGGNADATVALATRVAAPPVSTRVVPSPLAHTLVAHTTWPFMLEPPRRAPRSLYLAGALLVVGATGLSVAWLARGPGTPSALVEPASSLAESVASTPAPTATETPPAAASSSLPIVAAAEGRSSSRESSSRSAKPLSKATAKPKPLAAPPKPADSKAPVMLNWDGSVRKP